MQKVIEINPNQFVYETIKKHKTRKEAEYELLKTFFKKIKIFKAYSVLVRAKSIRKEQRFDTEETWWIGRIRFHLQPLSKTLKQIKNK